MVKSIHFILCVVVNEAIHFYLNLVFQLPNNQSNTRKGIPTIFQFVCLCFLFCSTDF